MYLDDILVASPTPDQHIAEVGAVLSGLSKAGLSINKDKCHFGVGTVNFFGHFVSPAGIAPLPAKVDEISTFPRPVTKVDLQRFLGFINFYHRFIPNLATVLVPLHSLQKSVKAQKAVLVCSVALSAAFEASKLAATKVVQFVCPDPSASLSLTTDASDVAVGAMLAQGDSYQPLGFYSKKHSDAEKKYRSCLPCSCPSSITAITLRAATSLCEQITNPCVGRSGALLSNLPSRPVTSHTSPTLAHVPSTSNVVADLLSRPSALDSPDDPGTPGAPVVPGVPVVPATANVSDDPGARVVSDVPCIPAVSSMSGSCQHQPVVSALGLVHDLSLRELAAEQFCLREEFSICSRNLASYFSCSTYPTSPAPIACSATFQPVWHSPLCPLPGLRGCFSISTASRTWAGGQRYVISVYVSCGSG